MPKPEFIAVSQDDNKGFARENSPFTKDLRKVVHEREASIERAFDVLGDYVTLPGATVVASSDE